LFWSKECPFSKLSGVDCPWIGGLSDIAVHIVAEHENETVEVEAHFRALLLDFVEESRYRIVVICSGELFYLSWKREGDMLSFEVFHFGPKNKTNAFKYGIKIGNSEHCVSVTRNCRSYLDCGLTEMQHRDCVTLPYSTVLDCLNASGHLSCEIEIGRENLDGFVSVELQESLQVAFAIGSNSEIRREMFYIPSAPRQSPPSPPQPRPAPVPQYTTQYAQTPIFTPPQYRSVTDDEPPPARCRCCWCCLCCRRDFCH
jgi:hypothetical protein